MPISNPRDVDSILDSMQDTYDEVDPAVDTRKGPLSVTDYAVAIELSRTESTADYVRTVYQLANPDAIEDDDIANLALNYGKDPNIGKAAQVLVYLYRNSLPETGVVYTADLGTHVSTDDGRFIYVLTAEATMNGDVGQVYWNATENRYEVGVIAEAIAIGDDYNLPPQAVSRFVNPVRGFDGVVNKDYASGGRDPVDNITIRRIVWDALQGVGADLAGSIILTIEDLDPTGFSDLALVPNTDYLNFKRLNSLAGKLGYDIYLITDSIREFVQTGVTQGGESFLPLERAPAVAVRYVTINGVETAFSLDVDTSPDVEGSPRANDRVTFAAPLQPAQAYEIRFVYYDLVYDAYQAFQGRIRPFETDVLPRRALTVPILIDARFKALSTVDREDLIEDIRSFTIAYLRNPELPTTDRATFYEILDPLEYQQAVEASVDGVTNFRLDFFAREDRAFMDIEIINFDGMTEYPILSPNFNVR